jgi:hypothetical protein
MPKVPDGAKKPSDRKPSQSVGLAADAAARPEGWDLLRPWPEIEFWEKTELTAALAKIKVNERDEIKMTSATINVVGEVGKLLQETFSVSPKAFREWLATIGGFDDQINAIVELGFPYANQLGEASSSAS